MKKCFFSLLLVMVLCVGLLPLPANATSTAWDGRTSEPFAGGDGSEDDPYQIANGAQLYYLTLQESTDYYYELTSDIDLNNKLFPIILTFEGTLNGKGLEISGLNVNVAVSNSVKAAGLIGLCTGTVSDLTLSGSVNSDQYINAGGIAGKLGSPGRIVNCINKCTVELTHDAKPNAGGIVGLMSGGNIDNCQNYGNVSGYYAGGIIGSLKSPGSYPPSHVVTGCVNMGTITGISQSDFSCAGGKFETLQLKYHPQKGAQKQTTLR